MIFNFLRHGSAWIYRLTTWLVLLVVLVAGTMLLVLQFVVLPRIDEYREPIAQSVAQAIGQTVEIGRIEGDWQDFRPRLRLFDVRIHEAGGQQTLAFDHVDTALSWRSFLSWNVVFQLIEIDGPDLEVRRDSLGTLWVAGTPLARYESGGQSKLAEWLIKQERIIVRGARISWIDEMRAAPILVVDDVTIRMENSGAQHQLKVAGVPIADLASAVAVHADFQGDGFSNIASWRGQIIGVFENTKLASLRQWVSLPVEFKSGTGSLRVSVDVVEGELTGLVADGDLVNVGARLAPDLEPLALAHLSGIFQWSVDAGAETFALSQFSVETIDGKRLSPASVEIRRPNVSGAKTELSIRSLELSPVAAMFKSLPLDAGLVAKIAKFDPNGVIDEMEANWVALDDGQIAYEIESQFRGLAVRPVDKLPGFSGMSGTVAVSSASGKISLKSESATLEFPGILGETISFSYLNGAADWEVENGQVRIGIQNISFANEHAAGKAHGTYFSSGKDKGDIDVRAVLVRSEAQHVWRYFPTMFPKVREWLRQGLAAGHSKDVRLHLEGPLHKFPFPDKRDGVFEVKAAVQDVSVIVKAGWPLIKGVTGDLLVNGDRIDIQPRSGVVMGVDVSDSRVSVLGLGSGHERVLGNGKAAGTVDQLLRFVANSPVAGYTKGSTAKMSGEGIGKLEFRLDLPLRSLAEVTVEGSLDLSGPRFGLGPGLPNLSNYRTRVEFTQNQVQLRNGRADALGGTLRFGTRASSKGTMDIGLSGSISAANLAAYADSPLLGHLYGTADWTGSLVFRNGESRLRAESTLVGIGSRLPAPLSKSGSTVLPTTFDVRSSVVDGKDYRLDIAKIGKARWTLKDGLIGRGAIEFGGVATLPAEGHGIVVGGEVALFDFDGWRAVFSTGMSDNARGGVGNFESLNLKIGKLRIAGRSFRSVQVAGERDAADWKISFLGPQVDGSISVLSNVGNAIRINAGFALLAVPPPEVSITAMPEEGQASRKHNLPPAMNLVVQDLRFEGRSLGLLQLEAEPDLESASWLLERLAISNPDGRMDVNGTWHMTDRPRTEYAVRLEAANVGEFLKRLGYGETMVGGSGTLSGPVTWRGSPFHPNVPTLTGKFKLNAVNGRFARVDPGAAQLIGILSLQAIPRRMILNFNDVFEAGFSFDRISADVTAVEGVASTDNFTMKGPAADVTMTGEVNLAAETQKLDIHVRPQLSGAAAIAGAAVVSPLVGVAALLVQKALGDPIEEAASRDYRVTGTWGNPRVERIKSVPEVPIPQGFGR